MQPRIYTSQEHHVRHDLIDPNALYVLKKLQDRGFKAYLVGGSVRDLLMHRKPKDFDISTSAEPEQVKTLFRSCILIGRRFRLAHVRFGDNIIEVSTFRSGENTEDELIVRDNVWGSEEEDVLRRDFTINGLFYNPSNHEIIDYVGGWEDLKHHLLRVIGNPIARFKQDPVRMIRLLKFRARFGFKIDPEAMEALEICKEEITKSSSARILEEVFRMMELAVAEEFFKQIDEHGLLRILFPNLSIYFDSPLKEQIYNYLKALDALNHHGRTRSLDRAILASALIFPILEQEVKTHFLDKNITPHIGEIMVLTQEFIHKLVFEAFTHFPRKVRMSMQFILQSQYRLTPFDKRKGLKVRFARHREFYLALTFLKLRTLVDHKCLKAYTQWRRIYETIREEKSRAEEPLPLESSNVEEV